MADYGLMVMYRHYECTACGHAQEVQTNHTGTCYAVCQSCSWKVHAHPGVHMLGSMHRLFKYAGPPVQDAERNPHATPKVIP